MKNRKEKERKKSWDQVFKLGLNPVHWYICILVTSTTTGHDGSVVSALASQGVQFPVMAIELTIHQFGHPS